MIGSMYVNCDNASTSNDSSLCNGDRMLTQVHVESRISLVGNGQRVWNASVDDMGVESEGGRGNASPAVEKSAGDVPLKL